MEERTIRRPRSFSLAMLAGLAMGGINPVHREDRALAVGPRRGYRAGSSRQPTPIASTRTPYSPVRPWSKRVAGRGLMNNGKAKR